MIAVTSNIAVYRCFARNTSAQETGLKICSNSRTNKEDYDHE